MTNYLKDKRKQISIFTSHSDWLLVRAEAARQKIPMTELCLKWMEPGLSKLRKDSA